MSAAAGTQTTPNVTAGTELTYTCLNNLNQQSKFIPNQHFASYGQDFFNLSLATLQLCLVQHHNQTGKVKKSLQLPIQQSKQYIHHHLETAGYK